MSLGQQGFQHGITIIRLGRPDMLRRQAIIHRRQFRPDTLGDFGADRIVAFQRTDHEAAAMQVEQMSPRAQRRRPVAADWDRADLAIGFHQPGRQRWREGGAKRIVPAALLLDGAVDRIHRIEGIAARQKGQDTRLRRHWPGRRLHLSLGHDSLPLLMIRERRWQAYGGISIQNNAIQSQHESISPGIEVAPHPAAAPAPHTKQCRKGDARGRRPE